MTDETVNNDPVDEEAVVPEEETVEPVAEVEGEEGETSEEPTEEDGE